MRPISQACSCVQEAPRSSRPSVGPVIIMRIRDRGRLSVMLERFTKLQLHVGQSSNPLMATSMIINGHNCVPKPAPFAERSDCLFNLETSGTPAGSCCPSCLLQQVTLICNAHMHACVHIRHVLSEALKHACMRCDGNPYAYLALRLYIQVTKLRQCS